MQNITTHTGLKEAISDLEEAQAAEWMLIKKDMSFAYESLKPINIFKHTIQEAITAPDIKDNIVNGIIGLASGFLAKKAIVGKTGNPLKKILGLVLEITVANKIAHNANAIKTVGGILLNKLTPIK
jgi:hypothetical protein